MRTLTVTLWLLCFSSLGSTTTQRIIVASHGRLQWLDAATGNPTPLHTGRGVYYGVFAAGAWLTSDGAARPSVWVVSRRQGGPSDVRLQVGGGGSGSAFWDDGLGPERLLRIDADSGEIYEQVVIASRFTHDAVRTPDGNHIMMADTATGDIHELYFPSLHEKKRHALFTGREHINTLAPGRDETVWAMLHKKGSPSSLVQANLSTGQLTGLRFDGFGKSAHGVVFLGEETRDSLPPEPVLLTLDSKNGRLLRLRGDAVDVLWADPEKNFLKGLCVVDGVAYFGINTWGSLMHRVSDETTADVIAFHVASQKVLWRRTVRTAGTLNVITVPQLGFTAPYEPQSNWTIHPDWHKVQGKTDEAVRQANEAEFDDYSYEYVYEYAEIDYTDVAEL